MERGGMTSFTCLFPLQYPAALWFALIFRGNVWGGGSVVRGKYSASQAEFCPCNTFSVSLNIYGYVCESLYNTCTNSHLKAKSQLSIYGKIQQ